MADELTRREREIMDILLTHGEASAEDVRRQLSNPPSSSATRVMLRRLEEKGAIKHAERGLRYVYAPVVSRTRARQSAIERIVKVFYEGSLAKAVTGLVGASARELSDEELDRIQEVIAEARRRPKKKGRRS